MKKSNKFASLLILFIVLGMMLTACGSKTDGGSTATSTDASETTGTSTSGESTSSDGVKYTYHTYTTALGNNWNPHTWETNADDAIQGYISSPLVDISIEDSENAIYQWVYEMATSVTDVTAEHQDDLEKYAVVLPEGQTAADTTEGYVFEIKLNENAKWEDGTVINADTYIYSMQQLLAPDMHNYRANNYLTGESAIAGALAYYNSGSPIINPVVAAYGEGEPDYSFDTESGDYKILVNLSSNDMTVSSYSFYDIAGYGYIDSTALDTLNASANAYGYVEVTDDNVETIAGLMDNYLSAFGASVYNEDGTLSDVYKEFLFYDTGEKSEVVSYDDTVGVYKVDDYTIRYVVETYIDLNYMLSALTSNWIVHEATYEAGKDTTGELVTTDYGTSKETSMAYGPYRIESLQEEKQIVFVRNENWYGYETDADGNLVSYTDFEVDGETKQQYLTDKVVIDVMQDDAAKQAFLKGELDEWSLQSDDALTYATSDQLYKTDLTYNYRLFFHTNLDSLKTMDESKGNTNSVVMSNSKFREAFSLSIDRAEFVTATPGWKPSYGILNNLYYYDAFNDPESSYRASEQAMEAICRLYGVEYGSGTAYADVTAAYESITGYNLTQAQQLMKEACEELVAAGLYTEGEDIVIRMGWKKAALDSADQNQVALLNKYINAAAEGSGFGTITLEAIDNVEDRYGDVEAGEYAIGWGAWGGAAFYPFTMFRVYCDPDYTDIHEQGCWNPAVETLTINVDGTDVTKTWQEWSNSMTGTGDYSTADFDTKLDILSSMEEEYLKLYYCIPIAGMTDVTMLSYKIGYYTEDYNIMYGFGGLRLLQYNYTDAEWADFLATGELSYD